MIESIKSQAETAEERRDEYELLARQIQSVCKDEPNVIANLANISAMLYEFLSHVNWVGFYLYDSQQKNLVLGPFQGKAACIRIPLGKGVCGTAYSRKETQNIADVESFPGHIACDSATKSEIVIPLIIQGNVLGVLDIDSPDPDRFDAIDQEGLEACAESCMEILSKDLNHYIFS
jgi:L-methionine (R)-S-oxide reductase